MDVIYQYGQVGVLVSTDITIKLLFIHVCARQHRTPCRKHDFPPYVWFLRGEEIFSLPEYLSVYLLGG